MAIRRMISRAVMMLVLMVLTASVWARDTYYIDVSEQGGGYSIFDR